MKKHSILTVLAICLAALFVYTGVLAKNYDISVSTASEYHDETETSSADIVIPEISGLCEGMAYREINDEFAQDGQNLIDQYKKDKADLLTESDPTQNPHFGYQYSYDVVTDSQDWFVVRTTQYYAAGSSSTVSKFFNFNKHEGCLVSYPEKNKDFDEETEAGIAAFIKDEMNRKNTDEAAMFFIENVDEALKSTVELRHFYYNAEGSLVIFFDKYQVAAGAQGSSEFVIPADLLP